MCFISFIPDSAIEEIRMNFIQAFSPPNKVRMSMPLPLRDGAEIIRAFSPFGQWLMVMRGTRRIMYPANNH